MRLKTLGHYVEDVMGKLPYSIEYGALSPTK
jgi:hypothetical protein